MILFMKRYGLVNGTGTFLLNPCPEPPEPAVVEAPDGFNKEKIWFGQQNRGVSGKSWSGAFRTGRRGDVGEAAGDFNKEKQLFGQQSSELSRKSCSRGL